MALIDFSKLNIFAFLAIIIIQLAGIATYVSDNTVNTDEAPQPNIYAGYPQAYYTPQLENQIQTAVESTETFLQSGYKIPVSAAKYIASQVAKPLQVTYGNQDNNPYLFAPARVVPATVAYPAQIEGGNKNEEIPKKYHYGYRVSNPYTDTEFGHSEVNNGHTAKGYYHVLLPDGRLQNVKYWAGPSGYHATITYETKY